MHADPVPAAMSPPGRPKGETRSAKREGTPVSASLSAGKEDPLGRIAWSEREPL